MDKLSSLSIFLPAFNEEKNIKTSVLKALEAAESVASAYEVIVINDASTDKTAKVVEKLIDLYPGKVKLVSHPTNKGYGGALTTGIKSAQYDYIFFTDADLQFDLSEIKLLTRHIDNHDAVIGVRKKRQDPFMRLVNAKGWNILNRILFGLKVKDIDCAFKLMRRNAVVHLPIRSQGAMVSAEMLILLQKQGARIKEIEVTHFPRTRGVATGAHPKVIIRAFKEMLTIFMSEVGRDTRKEILAFATIGVLNTVIDLGAYYLLTRHSVFFETRYVFAKVTSFFLGTISSFLLNKYVTFKQQEFRLEEVFKFYAVVSTSLVVNATVTYILTSLLGVYDLVSVVIATGATLITSFIGSKVFVFNQPTRKSLLHSKRELKVQTQ